jgi:hypothetical protein
MVSAAKKGARLDSPGPITIVLCSEE